MSEPKTDLALGLRKFMSLPPGQRDETLYLQVQRHKSILESESVVDKVNEIHEIMNGTTQQAGLVMRVNWLEEKTKKLTKSNERLQKALYVATGGFIVTKIFFDIVFPALHK